MISVLKRHSSQIGKGAAIVDRKITAGFEAVRDGCGHRIKNLCQRNGRFYGQLWHRKDAGKQTSRRFPLFNTDGTPAGTVADAKEALEILRHKRREQDLPAVGRCPGFKTYLTQYFVHPAFLRRRETTKQKDTFSLKRWGQSLGDIPLNRITYPMMSRFVNERLTTVGRSKEVLSARTVLLDLITLRGVFKAAFADGIIKELPRMPAVRVQEAQKRTLIHPYELERLFVACSGIKGDGEPVTKNGVQVRDYLHFLCYTGAREQEGLRMKWSDVDFTGHGRIVIGADGLAKNGLSRTVEFNGNLEILLKDMHTRRAPDSEWLFPSPQRGSKDVRAKSFRESLKRITAAAGVSGVGFHDFRHYFCSMCVMAAVDFVTIAGWMGHKDGGVLIGKVYGHLLDSHRVEAARKLKF